MLKQIHAFARGAASRDAFCRSAEKMGLSAIASKTAQEAIQDADLIVTSVTLSPQLVAFLNARWLKPGAFVTMTDLAAHGWLKVCQRSIGLLLMIWNRKPACPSHWLIQHWFAAI